VLVTIMESVGNRRCFFEIGSNSSTGLARIAPHPNPLPLEAGVIVPQLSGVTLRGRTENMSTTISATSGRSLRGALCSPYQRCTGGESVHGIANPSTGLARIAPTPTRFRWGRELSFLNSLASPCGDEQKICLPQFLPHQDDPRAALCARLASAAQGEGPVVRVFRAYPSPISCIRSHVLSALERHWNRAFLTVQ
jgi:hypothetical protein